MVLSNETLSSVPNPVHNLLSLVFKSFPDKVPTRQVLGSITRNLNVDLAGDQHLRTSCICLRLQDLFRVMSVSMQDRCKIAFEACAYLLRFGGCRRLLALLIVMKKFPIQICDSYCLS